MQQISSSSIKFKGSPKPGQVGLQLFWNNRISYLQLILYIYIVDFIIS